MLANPVGRRPMLLVAVLCCLSAYNYHEYLRLKARVEVLQRSQRNLLGEDLAPLNTKELEQLEHQLEMSMRKIRSTKTQCMLDQLGDLQRKEQVLAENMRNLSLSSSAPVGP